MKQKENQKIPLFFRNYSFSNLKASGNLDERDFLDRVDVLAKLGYTVMISNFSEYYRLVDYFTSYNVRYTGIAMAC